MWALVFPWMLALNCSSSVQVGQRLHASRCKREGSYVRLRIHFASPLGAPFELCVQVCCAQSCVHTPRRATTVAHIRSL